MANMVNAVAQVRDSACAIMRIVKEQRRKGKKKKH